MEVHRDPEQETSLPQSEKPHCEGYSVGNTHELLLDGRFIMDLLSFTTCPSFCKCLMVNRAFCKGVRSYLSTLVVDPEENQGWTVPVDVLRLAPRKKEDSARLVSAECGVSIEGPEEGLLQLNALLVPEPLVFVVGSKTYISLAPVLRCRWNGDASEGPWVVHFSFPGLVGFDKNFSNNVSVFRRPAGSSDGKWELLDLVNNEDDESDGGETVSVTVTHFSDLIAAIDNRRASENSKGYIIKPIGLRLLRRASKKVLLHNVSRERLSYFQYWPHLMRTSSNVGVEVLGTGVSGGAGITLRDPKEEIGEGYVDAWPRNLNTGRFTIPPPEPEKLDTRRRGWSLNMVVYTGTLASVKVLVRLECYPSSHVILLEDIINKRGSAPETRQAVR